MPEIQETKEEKDNIQNLENTLEPSGEKRKHLRSVSDQTKCDLVLEERSVCVYPGANQYWFADRIE